VAAKGASEKAVAGNETDNKGTHMKRLLTASILAASLASGAAFGQVGPYVGASVGGSQYSIPDIEGIDICSFASCDKSDVGFKVFGGYMFTPYIGAELHYVNYGTATASVPDASLEVKSSAIGGFLVGQYPIDNFRIFGKIGFAYVDSKATGTISGLGSASESDTSTNFAWGVGGTYMFNKNVGLRAEYEQAKWEIQGTSDTIGLWSIGVQYHF
jgi:OmpA-OmpF porin, OOP family